MVLFINFPAHIHLSKTVVQKEKYATLLKPVWFFSYKAPYLPNIGPMLFKQQYISSISYQLNSLIFSPFFKFFSIKFPIIVTSRSSDVYVFPPYALTLSTNSPLGSLLVCSLVMHKLIRDAYALMSPLAVSTFPEVSFFMRPPSLFNHHFLVLLHFLNPTSLLLL